VGEDDVAGGDQPGELCGGSGTAPSSAHQSIGQVAATWGLCPVCDGSYRVARNGLLVEHRPVG